MSEKCEKYTSITDIRKKQICKGPSVGPILALAHCQPPLSPKATSYSLVPKCPLATGDLRTHLIHLGSLPPTNENSSNGSSNQVTETKDVIFDSNPIQTLSETIDQFLQ